MDLNENIIYINGPINFFRIKNEKKDIYLFSDIHKNINEQTECKELNSVNIDKFLLHFFEKNKSSIDFMLETFKTYEDECENKIYLNKLRKMFNTIHKKNPYYKYLRIHYLDIRNYEYLDQIHSNSQWLIHYLKNNNIYDFKIIDEKLMTIKFYLKKIIEYYENTVEKKNNFQNLLNKIMNKYNDIENKKKINEFLNIHFYKKILYIIQFINDFEMEISNYNKIVKKNTDVQKYFVCNNVNHTKYIKKYNFFNTKKYFDIKYEVTEKINELYEQLNVVKLTLMDCYFLRRVIDKDYIHKTIVYTGFIHTIEYLYFLVKFFDFKIIDYDEKNFYTSKQIENLIYKSDTVYDFINKMLLKQNFTQCIKIKNFFK